MRILKGEEREKGKEAIFKVIRTENFLKLMSDIKAQVQEAQRTPNNKWRKKLNLDTPYSNFRKSKIF